MSAVQSMTGEEVINQRLVYETRQLEADSTQTLKKLGLKTDCTVYQVKRQRGG